MRHPLIALHRIVWSTILAAMLLVGCERQPNASTPAPQTTIAVAAASDLKFALDDVVAAFRQQQAGIDVQPTYGASGNLFAQITNGAPFDVFLSADIEFPRKLIEQQQAVAESEFPYAVGHLVVWVRKESALDVETSGIEILKDPAVRTIAIANPKTAPYGRAAEAALKHFHLTDAVQDKLVLGENIAQTAQFVESGAADAGIIALSLALAPTMKEKGRFWPMPLDAHPPLVQGGVILNAAKDKTACEKFCAFIQADSGRAILRKYGFELPGE